ncbi:MAG: monovalent cation/H+ antiporter subunit D family protein [Desulfobacterales bacterium]|nr:monovalent cation/H+ antiporter subunit D family protein [Desulfobacterales bacterium]
MTGAVASLKPILALGCPLLGAGMIYICRRQPNAREACTLVAAVLLFIVVISMAPLILAGNVLFFRLVNICPGLELGFRVDAFGLLFAITASFLWILVSLYSIGYMRSLNEHAQTRYYGMFALAIFSAVCIAMAENLVTFYVFYEALTLSTYWLVAHHEDEAAFAATRKYLTYLLVSGWFLFAAVVMTYALTGTTRFADGGILAVGSAPRWTLIVLFILFALGSMKAAWMPLHSWLPAAMVAPTPVSSLLHAVAVVKAGVFGFVRIVCHVFGIDLFAELGLGLLLGGVASFTMIVASFLAIGQDNLKRRLAYSTISQLSYILFGVALLSPFGVKGAMIHIPFHAFMKITLFLSAGAIMVITGKKAISQLAGIGRQMPITMTAFTIGAVGMCGAPPVAGFISKWYLCLGSVQSGHLIFLGVILVSSLLDVIYFFPIIKTAFFDNPAGAADGEHRTAPRLESSRPLYLFMVVPLALTACFSIVFCFFPGTFYILDLVEIAVRNLFTP